MTSSRSTLPTLLEPYIRLPPEASLIVLTGITTATPHWLTVRFLARLLGTRNNDEDGEEYVGVVMASWMRDEAFWAAEARRGAGLDLRRLHEQGRWRFVDGLTNLFAREASGQQPRQPSASHTTPTRSQAPSAPTARSPAPIPQRSPLPVRPLANPPSEPTPSTPPAPNASSLALDKALSTISTAIDEVRSKTDKVFLILDAPTLLLAAATTAYADLTRAILQLRSQVHSALIVVEADKPLLAAAAVHNAPARATPLEAEHAAFVAGMAHAARMVVGTRGLDTGVAKDVSGVLTVRRGGAGDGEEKQVEEMEVLYRVGVDGSVRVFERGTGDG